MFFFDCSRGVSEEKAKKNSAEVEFVSMTEGQGRNVFYDRKLAESYYSQGTYVIHILLQIKPDNWQIFRNRVWKVEKPFGGESRERLFLIVSDFSELREQEAVIRLTDLPFEDLGDACRIAVYTSDEFSPLYLSYQKFKSQYLQRFDDD